MKSQRHRTYRALYVPGYFEPTSDENLNRTRLGIISEERCVFFVRAVCGSLVFHMKS